MQKTIFQLLILILLFACNVDEIKNTSQQGKKVKIENESYSILLQPFVDLPTRHLKYLDSSIRLIYPNVKVNEAIVLPKHLLNNDKTRYRADSIIKFLSRGVNKKQFIIGLTTKDISTTKESNLDWGVMGLGYCPGNSCVVSSFRIIGENKLEKIFKVCIHELGHNQGLVHCPNSSCYMRDAKGKDHLNVLKYFCSTCKNVLLKSGWSLN